MGNSPTVLTQFSTSNGYFSNSTGSSKTALTVTIIVTDWLIFHPLCDFTHSFMTIFHYIIFLDENIPKLCFHNWHLDELKVSQDDNIKKFYKKFYHNDIKYHITLKINFQVQCTFPIFHYNPMGSDLHGN